MKIELPCEVIRDLLPNYVDGLASRKTVEVVKTHLDQCKACHNIYSSMKEESEGVKNVVSLGEDEKMLFKKINHKVNKKVRLAIAIGIASVIFVLGATQLLFNVPIKAIKPSDVKVAVSVYPLEDLITGRDEGRSEDTTVISKEEVQNDEIYSISIPNMPNAQVAVTKDMMEDGEYLTYISWESPYLLRDIKWETKTVNDQNIMYVTGFKTTLLNNQVPSNGYIMPTMEFQKLDKIVYVEDNGAENVLWECN